MKIQLRSLDGGAAAQVYEFSEGTLQIGRGSSNHVVFDDRVVAVSRRHAELRSGPEVWSVVDLGSTNGTYVSGRRVSTAVLRNGDEIRFGSKGPRFGVVLPVGRTATPEVTTAEQAQTKANAAPAGLSTSAIIDWIAAHGGDVAGIACLLVGLWAGIGWLTSGHNRGVLTLPSAVSRYQEAQPAYLYEQTPIGRARVRTRDRQITFNPPNQQYMRRQGEGDDTYITAEELVERKRTQAWAAEVQATLDAINNRTMQFILESDLPRR